MITSTQIQLRRRWRRWRSLSSEEEVENPVHTPADAHSGRWWDLDLSF